MCWGTSVARKEIKEIGQERDQRDRRGLGRSGTLATTVRGEVGGAS